MLTVNRPFRALCLAIASAVAGCGSSAPPSTTAPPPATNTGVSITGGERLGWTQNGDGADRYVYALYVDESRNELSGASCTASAPQVFDCQSPLPRMTNGTHTLQLTAAVRNGNDLVEGPRSAAFVVIVSGSGDTRSVQLAPEAVVAAGQPAQNTPPPQPSCGLGAWDATHVLAWTSGGELTEAGGARHSARPLTWTNEAGAEWRLNTAISRIEKGRRFVFLALTSNTSEPRLRVLRYREVGGVLGERATVLDGPLPHPPTAANASVAPDGRVSIALAWNAPLATPEPFVVNVDPRASPAVDMDVRFVSRAPIAGTWDADGRFWIVEKTGGDVTVRTGDTAMARLSVPDGDSIVGVQPLEVGSTARTAIFTSRGMGWTVTADVAATQQPSASRFVPDSNGGYQGLLVMGDGGIGCAARPSLSLTYARPAR